MNFSSLPLKTKERIIISFEIALFIGSLTASFLIPKSSIWYDIKYIMFLGIFLLEKRIRHLRNIDRRMSEGNISSANYMVMNIVFLLLLVVMALTALPFYHF